MLDLKSKLLAAGLVTKEQIARVEKKSTSTKHKKPIPKAPSLSFEERERARQLQELKGLQKPDQYELIRKWVARNRLDRPTTIDSEQFAKFFFQGSDGAVTWLTLEKAVHNKITEGSAGITAFMSHHGIAHCVLPRDIVEDIAAVFPNWLRVLKGHPALDQTD